MSKFNTTRRSKNRVYANYVPPEIGVKYRPRDGDMDFRIIGRGIARYYFDRTVLVLQAKAGVPSAIEELEQRFHMRFIKP